MANIIDQIYGQNLGCGPPLTVSETVGRVLGIENHLLSWVLALPDSLRQLNLQSMRDEIEIENQRSQADAQHVQLQSQPQLYPLKFRIILTLRYLHVQILLHRPVLVKFLDATRVSGVEPREEKLLTDIGHSSTAKCVEAAMQIIDIIHELVSAADWPRDLLGAWWYSLYYSMSQVTG